jgi:hypothetical protein
MEVSSSKIDRLEIRTKFGVVHIVGNTVTICRNLGKRKKMEVVESEKGNDWLKIKVQ